MKCCLHSITVEKSYNNDGAHSYNVKRALTDHKNRLASTRVSTIFKADASASIFQRLKLLCTLKPLR